MYLAAEALALVTVGYLVLMICLSQVAPRRRRGRGLGLHYVFLVPCLNEELVIRNTLDSLTALPPERAHVIVIDDGSTDRTAELARSYPAGQVTVLSRVAPNARQGKGAALNAACALAREMCSGIDPHRLIVAVVDADGQLPADVLDATDRQFADPKIGAVQLLVRIKNRDKLLARFQDFEFVSFSSVMQTARQHLGSVGLGGNGQFVRLAALNELGEEPWTDCLTEDLDLGLRLATAGWINSFTDRSYVAQQGVERVRPLLRQRTRWLQGHMQCWGRTGSIIASPLPNSTVADLLYYLAAPAVLLVASVLFTIPLIGLGVALAGGQLFAAADGLPWLLRVLAWYALAFGPSLWLAGIYQHRAKDISRRRAFLLGNMLVVYNYIWYVAAWRAAFKLVTGQTGWVKTARVQEAHHARRELVPAE